MTKEEIYTAEQKKAKLLIMTLQNKLNQHSKEFETNGNYGHIGDLCYVIENLTILCNFLNFPNK